MSLFGDLFKEKEGKGKTKTETKINLINNKKRKHKRKELNKDISKPKYTNSPTGVEYLN